MKPYALDSASLKDPSNSTFSPPNLWWITTENPTWKVVAWVLFPDVYSQGQQSPLDSATPLWSLGHNSIGIT